MGQLRRLAWRIGHRGAFLLFLGVLDALIAYSFTRPEVAAQLRHINLILPASGWAIAWAAAAAVVTVGAFARQDRLAFAFASGFKGLWALLYMELWLVQHIPDAWIQAVIWAVFAAIVLDVSAAMPPPAPPPGQPP